MSDFNEKLIEGKTGESQIAQWLKARGNHILPVYEIADGQFKGPAVYTSSGGTVIAPDMLIFGNGKVSWIEAKHKNAFSMHRITNRFVTGIDLHHYYQYRKIMRLCDWPVWLMFLHRGGKAKDSEVSPAGLFGHRLEYLMQHENHRHENHGKSGMVYWAHDTLIKFADYPLIC